ncbi:ribosome maturation factor RimM [Paenibacillus senegalensis]|uniref:ribosome maturation factor RimM n=1 Tax=Paenibacillus senegalensis TaxID=1465766 RepID=UPI000289FB32|nr:ribosome maturation factor RimM [Paenibacillus senegalensis]
MESKLYNVGKIVNTHGIRGELKVVPSTDFADIRFAKGSKLVLTDEHSDQHIPVEVTSARQQKNVFLIKLNDWNDINEVQKYKGWRLKIAESELSELEPGEYYHHQIIGCRVLTEDGEELGQVSEILSPGANDVWVVERTQVSPGGKNRPLLIPYIDDVVLDVDLPQQVITIRLMEGLLDL